MEERAPYLGDRTPRLVRHACVALLLLTAPVAAQSDGDQARPQEEEDVYAGAKTAKDYNPETAIFGPFPRWRSEDGNYNFGVGMIMQFDMATYGQSDQGTARQSLNPDYNAGLRARRGILLASGLIHNDFIVFFAHDIFDTGDAPMDGLRSAVLAYRGLDPWWLIVGQQNIGSPLDAATFSSRRMFMEEAMSSGAFSYAPGTPALGISTLYRTQHNYLRLGLFGVPAKEIGGDSEGYGVHGRATYAPIAERDRALHFGVAGYWRVPTGIRGTFGGTEQFSARPETRVDDTPMVDTGAIPRINDFYFVALEFLAVYDSLAVQAEYHYLGINRYNGPHDTAFRDLSFNGYYVQASYYLTGESPNFYPRQATLWRVQPHNPFDLESNGWGALEVAVRYSHIDLDDGVNDLARGGVRGGIGDNYTIALNWYPTALIRVSVNYVHSDIDNTSDTGLSEGDVIDAIALRLQWEF